MMISMLRYKAERAGGWFAIVNARNTSQECWQCGGTVQKDLSVRIQKMRALQDGGPPRRQRGPERPETGRSGSVERLCARKQRPGCRPSLRTAQARSSPPNNGKDFELRHYLVRNFPDHWSARGRRCGCGLRGHGLGRFAELTDRPIYDCRRKHHRRDDAAQETRNRLRRHGRFLRP